jgi:acetoin:2,6-dichlorophenolindophenol oxidoreductase subunit beta
MAKLSYREAIRRALREELKRDPSVVLMGIDIGKAGGVFKVTQGLAEEFGGTRVRDTPISEAAIVGAALGAAITGLRPVAEIMFADFAAVAMDQIVNQAAKFRYVCGGQTSVPLVIRAATGGGVSYGAHHSQSVEGWFLHFPGLKVVTPSTPADALGLLKTAIRDDDPVVFCEHKGLYGIAEEVADTEYTTPFGEAIVRRTGQDVTIVACLMMVHQTLAAADRLSELGINAEIIDVRTLAPLDLECIRRSVRKTGRLVTVEEGVKRCGFGAEIAASVAGEDFDYLDAPVQRVALENIPLPFSRVLEREVLPNADRIVQAVLKVVDAR